MVSSVLFLLSSAPSEPQSASHALMGAAISPNFCYLDAPVVREVHYPRRCEAGYC